jgi:methanethiol S-methyltransferase
MGPILGVVARLAGWLGGVAFAVSLAACGWWYFVRLDNVATGSGLPAVARDGALLAMFAAHHSVFAREPIKRRLRWIPRRLVRTLYVWVSSALFIVVIGGWQPIGGEVYQARNLMKPLFWFVQLAGVALIWRAVAGLNPLDLAGIREAAGQPPGRRELLRVDGPYRWVRHPVYLGWVLLFCGVPHMTADRLVFAALTSLYLVAAIPLEERSLVQTFGDEYVRYGTRVRWRMVPFVY